MWPLILHPFYQRRRYVHMHVSTIYPVGSSTASAGLVVILNLKTPQAQSLDIGASHTLSIPSPSGGLPCQVYPSPFIRKLIMWV
ncbi:hypothetical protein Moror_11299 [Moniliophthora roreri MCA 2997]|uniref:Uncharacterized protein n=1 Tax=Moniliophthora roreri (strain MCA 2997) TaxID=1381753 RepID=V2X1S7_MONRO|nr:hypothetical protein Moror_11299 [Moniliophthora roreri MCA 2997]